VKPLRLPLPLGAALPTATLVAIAMAAALGLLPAACSVNRLSDQFACTTDRDCHDGRSCDQGFCVEAACPPGCTSCDLDAHTCNFACSAAGPCGHIHCASGYDCTVRCDGADACDQIDCSDGHSCDIQCAAGQACGEIDCSGHACNIACSADGACRFIDCGDACRCDVDCKTAAACDHMACPVADDGTICTVGNQIGGVCTSMATPGCDTCGG
jgi:hypothetical protein